MKLKLPDSVASTQDLAALILEVRDYARWFAHESIKSRVHATHPSQRPEMSAAASELIRSVEAKKSPSRQDFDDLVTSLTHIKNTAPTMTITLAAPATSDIKRSLAGWCRSNISADILIDFQFNRTLLGGMVLRSGSHIFDWSFRRQILTARDAFPEVLRRV